MDARGWISGSQNELALAQLLDLALVILIVMWKLFLGRCFLIYFSQPRSIFYPDFDTLGGCLQYARP